MTVRTNITCRAAVLYRISAKRWSPTIQPEQSSDGLILFTLLRSADTNTKISGLNTEGNRQ